ncbi:MAG: restriction endonuclease subunit S [Ignavibacteriae bacterium]|nr:restriction endonuclease subunit S [Ignavibacteriota bacterium]
MTNKDLESLNFPNTWIKITLNELLELIRNGLSRKQNKSNIGIPVSRIETISNELINYEKVGFIENLTEEEVKKYSLQYGDILFSNINSDSHLGKTAIFFNHQPLLHGMNLLLIRVDKNIISFSFLNSVFQLYRFSGVFISIAQHAVNQSSINQSKLNNLLFPLPPLNEQHRIVEKIEELFTKLDASVTELKNVKKQLKRYRQSVLKSAFEGKFDSSKSKWNIYTLGELILESQLGLVRSKREQNNLHQGTAYIKMNNVGMDGSVSLNNLVYVEVSNEEKNKYLLKESDILFNTRNSLELVGKTGIITRLSEEIIYNNNLMRIRFGENINPQFIVYQMCSLEFRANMELVKKSTTNVAAIYAKDLFPLKIKAPSIDAQKLIVEEIESRLSVADKIEEEIDKNLKRTEQLRQSILKKAFEGKLVPQDPNDEPAEKLLERIRKERELKK